MHDFAASRFTVYYGLAFLFAPYIYLMFQSRTDNYSLSLDILGLFSLGFGIYAAVATTKNVDKPDPVEDSVKTRCPSCKSQSLISTAPQNAAVQAEEVAEANTQIDF